MLELCTLPFILLLVFIAEMFPPDPPREPDTFTVEKQKKSTQVWGDFEVGNNPEEKR